MVAAGFAWFVVGVFDCDDDVFASLAGGGGSFVEVVFGGFGCSF